MTGCGEIRLWEKSLYFLFLVLVCISILLVRQHVLWDIPAAVAASELTLFLSDGLHPERVPEKLF